MNKKQEYLDNYLHLHEITPKLIHWINEEVEED